MDHFGYSIWTEVLMGDADWMHALNLGDPNELDFENDAWTRIFGGLEELLHREHLYPKIGGCLHFSSALAAFLKNPAFNTQPAFDSSIEATKKRISVEMGMHSTFGRGDRVTEGKFEQILRQDLEWAAGIQATSIVEHMPDTTENITANVVEELVSPPIVNLMNRYPICLAWENSGPDKYAGSLRNLVEFRQQLVDRLTQIGQPELIAKHLFCLDTGHLLFWRDQSKCGPARTQAEIAEFLPQFAKFIKVFHIHANDGTGDQHLIPGSIAYTEHPSRKGINWEKFSHNSEEVIKWLKICDRYKSVEGRHIHLEALRLPFDMDQIHQFLLLYQK
jgi:hypothetical protein